MRISYALVHYPSVDTDQIEQLRRKYDPQFNLISAHITIIFPVTESIGAQKLISHIESVLCHWEPFPIELKGLKKSWDDYLFLTLGEGRGELIRLHEELYRGVLAEYRRGGWEYEPHMTLGEFSGEERRYVRALKEAEGLGINYRSVVERVDLVKIDEEDRQIMESKGIQL